MEYDNICEGIFISRPNRFTAIVDINGAPETVHVKNTGRLKELLTPGAQALLTRSPNPDRKTRFDLVAVRHGGQTVNIDSQAPNRVAAEYMETLYPGAQRMVPEYRRGDSRLDIYLEDAAGRPVFIEVKGVTLIVNGTALFPDAPTLRGVKHLRELTACAREGLSACILFIIQLKGAQKLRPNDTTHPEFGAALREAAAAGVRLLAVDCTVTDRTITADRPVPVVLD